MSYEWRLQLIVASTACDRSGWRREDDNYPCCGERDGNRAGRVGRRHRRMESRRWNRSVHYNRCRAELTTDRESPINKLSSFLLRHAYQPLTLSTQGSNSTRPARPRVLLMTSLPNLTHLPTREAFHDALLQFCKSYSTTSSPLVIVHSDAGSSGRAEESWMDRERGGREGVLEVVGKDVKNGPWATEIE